MTPYGITKYTGELLAECYASRHGLRVLSPRFFNVYGPGDVPGKYRAVIPNFIQAAQRGEEITITGEKQARDFTYVKDVVRAVFTGVDYLEASERGAFVKFNIAKGEADKILELAEFIIRLTGSSSPLNILPDRDWEGIQERVGNNTEFKELMPGVAKEMTATLDGIEESYYDWYQCACK
jgi:nucleoside-diphosphate-sugar epimerase